MTFFIFFYTFSKTYLKINDIYFCFLPKKTSFFLHTHLFDFQQIKSTIFYNNLIFKKIFFYPKKNLFQRKMLILHQNSAKRTLFGEFLT